MLITLGRLALDNQKLSRPKTLSLLAYLALEGRKPRIHVRELLWGTALDAAASLRIVVQQLRNVGVLLEESKSLACAIPCDAALLLEKLDAGDDASAVTMYTGVFLDGLQVDSNEFEEWVLATREHLASRVIKAHLHLAQTAMQQADLPTAAQHAVSAHAISKTTPLEPNDVLEMLGILEDCSHDLAATVRQELQDLEIPIPDRNKAAVRNLPSAISGFVFRSEQAALETLLQTQRLVTVVGYGGAGKSRLALEVLRGLPESISTFFVPLEPILKPTDVPSACLRAMSYRESVSEPFEQLKNQIGQKNMVLLLDNAEHLVSIGEMLLALLESCSNLRVLLTSRERLGVLGETVFPLEGFQDDESALELLDLACRRTGTTFVWHTKTAIKICNLLERFPLAIELAAALITVLPLTEILEALQQHLDALEAQGGRERHRSMRAVFNWSWSLLSNPQRLGLMRLAVFRDGFSRVAALQVMNSNFTVIAALVAKSLVQNLHNGRYKLHPLIAQYCLEALESIPKEAGSAKAAHAEVFLSWLEQNAPLVRTAQAGMVLGAFETDLENVKSAWGWLCEHPDLARFDRLQDVVSLFDARARFEEGVQLFEAAIRVLEPKMAIEYKTKPEQALQTQSIIKINLAWLLYRISKFELALYLAAAVYENVQKFETGFQLKILNVLGTITRVVGSKETALIYFKKAKKIALKLNLQHRLGILRSNIGEIYLSNGEYTKAIHEYIKAKKSFFLLNLQNESLNLNLSILHLRIICLNDILGIKKLIEENIENSLKENNQMAYKYTLIYDTFYHSKIEIDEISFEKINKYVYVFSESPVDIKVFFNIAYSQFLIKTLKYSDAENYILKTIEVCKKNKLELLFYHGLSIAIKLYLKTERFDKAAEYYKYLVDVKIPVHWLKKEINELEKNYNLRLLLHDFEQKRLLY